MVVLFGDAAERECATTVAAVSGNRAGGFRLKMSSFLRDWISNHGLTAGIGRLVMFGLVCDSSSEVI